MERTDMERSKRTLETMLEDVEQPLRRREEIAVENAPDTLDLVQRAADRELAIRRIESDFSRIQKIRLALDRIADGSYGVCLRCDEEISAKRLQAIPWASYCIHCQDIADREQAAEESPEMAMHAHAQEFA